MASKDWGAPSIGLTPRQTRDGPRLARLDAALEARIEAERDQLPLWLPVGLGLGIGAWFALPETNAWIAFLALASAAFLFGLAAAGRRWGKALALFALAAMIGHALIWWRAESAAAPVLAWPRMVTMVAEIESVQRMPAREAVRLVVRPADPALPRARVNVPEDRAGEGLVAGATVSVRAWLMPPPPAAVPGAYDFARAAWFQRIGATGRALGEPVVLAAPQGQGWRARIAGWRQDLGRHVQSRLDEGGEAGIATALATGDQHAIPEEDAEAMRRSGLAHLLSVSGLHLTAVVGAVMLLTLKLLALSPTLALRCRLVLIAAAAGALAGVAYTLLTGAEVPTIRACIASLLVLAGIALGRDAITLRLVAVGALVVLLLWPESLVGASFQMSFAAMTALVALHEHPRIKALLARRDEGALYRAGRFVLALILTGLAVEIALTPIALYHFHKAGFYGALANLVAIPLTTFVVMPLEALALLFDLVGLGAPFWWLTEASLGLLLWIAHSVADAPGSVAFLPTMSVEAFALMLGGGLWFCLWSTGWRWWGAAPFALGAGLALAVSPPDILVTSDGRHAAIRTAQGDLALLRARAGDYVRDMLGETAGIDGKARAIEDLPTAACSRDLCTATLSSNGRLWRLLATRSRDFVEIGAMVRACRDADIIVSDRHLPRTCTPRWLKADRDLLRRTGGLAIRLGEAPSVETVAARGDGHPWVEAVRAMQGRPRARSEPTTSPTAPPRP